MTEKIGVVKLVRHDGKGVQLEDGTWASNKFLKENLSVNKGDKVKVTLNSKGFLSALEVMEKSTNTYTPKNQSGIEETARLRRELDWDMKCLELATQLVVAKVIPKEKLLENFNSLKQSREVEVEEVEEVEEKVEVSKMEVK